VRGAEHLVVALGLLGERSSPGPIRSTWPCTSRPLVPVEHRHLALELRRRPAVVRVEEREELARRLAQRGVAAAERPPFDCLTTRMRSP
jgi:hypothetical protein